MKPLFAALIVLSLVMSLVGCGSTAPTPAPAAPSTTSATPAPAAPAAPVATSEAPAPAVQAAPAAPVATETVKEAAPAVVPAPVTAPAATTPDASASKPVAAAPTQPAALKDVVHATVHTPGGDIHVELFHKTAPISVENFVKLTREKFFDGLAFHRVVAGFVAQGGDPNTKEGATGPVGNGGPGYTIAAEVGPSNPEKHTPGTLGMADSGPGTAGSQFYITLATTPHLDGRYTVFGRVSTPKDLEMAKKIKRGDRFSVTIDDDAAAAKP